jgi:hypothetical protein
MDRRTFLLGLIGGLTAAMGLATIGSSPAQALSPTARPADAGESADVKSDDLEGVRTEDAQYYYRRRRRYYRRAGRYYRRGYRRAGRYYRRGYRRARRYVRRRYY